MTRRPRKRDLITEVVHEFRVSGNVDSAFDSLAAAQLGVSDTDLRCLNVIENSGGLSAGELAVQRHHVALVENGGEREAVAKRGIRAERPGAERLEDLDHPGADHADPDSSATAHREPPKVESRNA